MSDLGIVCKHTNVSALNEETIEDLTELEDLEEVYLQLCNEQVMYIQCF